MFLASHVCASQEADDEEDGTAPTEAAAEVHPTPGPAEARPVEPAAPAAEKSPTVTSVPTTLPAAMEFEGQAGTDMLTDRTPAPGTPETPGTIGEQALEPPLLSPPAAEKEASMVETTELPPVGEVAETESDSRDIAPAAESTLSTVIASFTDRLVAKVSEVVDGDAATRGSPPDPDQSPRPAAAAPAVDGVASFSKDLVPAPGGPEVADVTLLAAADTENADAADADYAGAETMATEQPPVRVNSRRVDGRVLCPDPTCGRTFGTDSALYGHMRIHGGATQSKRSRSLTVEPTQQRLSTMDGDDSDTSSPAPKVRRISRTPALSIDGAFDLDDGDTVFSENAVGRSGAHDWRQRPTRTTMSLPTARWQADRRQRRAILRRGSSMGRSREAFCSHMTSGSAMTSRPT